MLLNDKIKRSVQGCCLYRSFFICVFLFVCGRVDEEEVYLCVWPNLDEMEMLGMDRLRDVFGGLDLTQGSPGDLDKGIIDCVL